jgi:hypothetical protein
MRTPVLPPSSSRFGKFVINFPPPEHRTDAQQLLWTNLLSYSEDAMSLTRDGADALVSACKERGFHSHHVSFTGTMVELRPKEVIKSQDLRNVETEIWALLRRAGFKQMTLTGPSLLASRYKFTSEAPPPRSKLEAILTLGLEFIMSRMQPWS